MERIEPYYAKYVSEGQIKAFIDDIHEKTGIPKKELKAVLGVTPDGEITSETKARVIREALTVLDPIEVLRDIATDLWSLHMILLYDIMLDAMEYGCGIDEILNKQYYTEMLDILRAAIQDLDKGQRKNT